MTSASPGRRHRGRAAPLQVFHGAVAGPPDTNLSSLDRV